MMCYGGQGKRNGEWLAVLNRVGGRPRRAGEHLSKGLQEVREGVSTWGKSFRCKENTCMFEEQQGGQQSRERKTE